MTNKVMSKTKIDWCDSTCNPVKGCPNGCKYCYAERMNKRFHWVKTWSRPEWFPDQLTKLRTKRPHAIFMDSMSDCAHWKINEIEAVANHMQANPQHSYLFLTKRPELFCQKCGAIIEASQHNTWIGTTITTRDEIWERLAHMPLGANRFVSVEPILQDFGDLTPTGDFTKWNSMFYPMYAPEVIIIGAETGTRKGKVIPTKEWILRFVESVDKYNQKFVAGRLNTQTAPMKIYMKESLRNIMGEDFRQDPLPWIERKAQFEAKGRKI